MCFRSVCNYCPNLDQVPNVILDQIPQKELDQSTVDRFIEGIARRIPLLKSSHDIQLAATAMAVNMAGNIYLNYRLFLSMVTTSLFSLLN